MSMPVMNCQNLKEGRMKSSFCPLCFKFLMLYRLRTIAKFAIIPAQA